MIEIGIIIGILMLVAAGGLAFLFANDSQGVATPDLDDEREMIRQWQEEIEENKNKEIKEENE